jgi:hypothetical protein
MSGRFFGFRFVHRKIEDKLLQFARIPGKYFEALYVECSTRIECHTLDIIEMEEKKVRGLLLELMKAGEVDTKIELHKYQLFERLNSVTSMSKEIRLLMDEHMDDIQENTCERLVDILKRVSATGKIMSEMVEALYDNYEEALEQVNQLRASARQILDGLYDFKFCVDGKHEYSFEKPEVLIGNAIRDTLQEMLYCADKIVQMIAIFSFNHSQLKERIEEEKTEEKEEEK